MDHNDFSKCLTNPKIYGNNVIKVTLIQTHISYVALTGKYAYKIKKPVNFGFLDFSSLDKRKYFCNEELKLNKRLCPEIYESVVSITKKDDSFEIDGKGEIIDYALKMKQFSQDNIISNKLSKDEIDKDTIDKIIDQLVSFYHKEESNEEINEFGKVNTIKQNTDENFEQTKEIIDVVIQKEKYDTIKKITNKFLEEKKDIFQKRIKEGFIKDCHGDLHSGNIVIKEGKICIFDCIEFNKRFRYGDQASDIAFLAMDLDYQGRPYLSSYLIKRYVEKSNDKEIYDVLNFYKSYRAYVRGKVAGFRLSDPNLNDAEKKDIIMTAQKYFDLSYYFINLLKAQMKSKKPILFITTGLTGTGKTSISNKISVDYNAKKISTDEVRKELLGIDKYERHHEPYNTGIYSPEKMNEIYEKIVEMGKDELIKNKNVILDATFKTKKLRNKAKFITDKIKSKFLIINSIAPEEVVKKYLEDRVKKKSISDGRWEIYKKQKNSFEKLDSDENYILIDVSNKDYGYQIDIFSKIYHNIMRDEI